jgi:tetracenomycin A2 monooxygenase-dioxygenase
VLVRPDGHVAWTCARAVEPVTQLLAALDLTLGRDGDQLYAVSA